MTTSSQLRETGNLHYNGGNFSEAIGFYNQALSAATSHDDRASANKNLFKSNTKIIDPNMNTDLQKYYWSEAFVYGFQALEYGILAQKPDSWLQTHRGDLLSHQQSFLSFVTDILPSARRRSEVLTKLIRQLEGDHRAGIRSFLHYQNSRWFLQQAIVKREKEEFRNAHILLGNCHQEFQFALESSKRAQKQLQFLQFLSEDDLDDLEDSLVYEMTHAEAAHQLETSNSLLRELLHNEFSVELVWDALDSYQKVLHLSSGGSSSIESSKRHLFLELEMHAYSKMGEIYFKILKMEAYARRYLDNFAKESNKSESLKENLFRKEWFQKAHQLLQALIQKEEDKKKAFEAEAKIPYREMVASVFAELKKCSDSHSLLKYCWSNYPAVPPERYQLPDPIPPDELVNHLKKSVTFYHPDKHQRSLWECFDDEEDVKTEKRKTFVIYEEISKLVNEAYSRMKSCT